MNTYQITSSTGIDFGPWEGDTAAHALYLMYMDACLSGIGYDENEDRIVFHHNENRDLAGNPEDWTIEEIA